MSTLRGMAISIRSFLKTMLMLGLMDTDLTNEVIVSRKNTLTVTKTPPFKEVLHFLDSIPTKTNTQKRNRAVAEAAFGCGLKVLEITSLKELEVIIPSGTLIARDGKWGRQRAIPIPERTSHYLEDYLENARPYLVEGDSDPEEAFLDNDGNPMTEAFLHSMIRGLAQEIRGCPNITGAGSLRDACGRHLLKTVPDLFKVSQYMGFDHIAEIRRLMGMKPPSWMTAVPSIDPYKTKRIGA